MNQDKTLSIGTRVLPKSEYSPKYAAKGVATIVSTVWNQDYNYLDYILKFDDGVECPFGAHELEVMS